MNVMWKLQDIVPTKREQHALPPVGRGLANQEIADQLNGFTLTSTSTALISGIVYKDEDGDEIYDANVDIPIPGAIVSALIGHEIVAIDCTDEKGEYALSVPAGAHYFLKVTLLSGVACYNPESKRWGFWSTIEGGSRCVLCPADNQDISVKYRMLNYGPKDFSWELWHKGPLFDTKNVVLIHGFRFPGATKKGRCDKQFGKLDDLLQTKDSLYNVWQFEYADSIRGTPDTLTIYAERLGQAIDRISEFTGKNSASLIGYSMGGIIARQYIANGGKSRVNKLLTLATPHMGLLQVGPLSHNLTHLVLSLWPSRFDPQVAWELRPASKLLWDLNTKVESSTVPEFASVGGHSWGYTDGLIDMTSTKLARLHPDRSVAESVYFTVVNRSHININNIRSKYDEVFELIRNFLSGGVLGLSNLRPSETTKITDVHYLLTFALKKSPGWRRFTYPYVAVANTGHRYRGFGVVSEGAQTDDGAYIFAVRLRPEDYGEALIYYAPGKYSTIQTNRGESTIITEPLGDSNVLKGARMQEAPVHIELH
jgi:pimeloyl-ACP methyl ester carboxylesterase